MIRLTESEAASLFTSAQAPAPRRKTKKKSPGEESFALQCVGFGLPMPVREHRFHDARQWRFDFAWPQQKLALEIEGGIFRAKGAHNTPEAITRDCQKGNAAALLGWMVLRATTAMAKDGTAARQVKEALAMRSAEAKRRAQCQRLPRSGAGADEIAPVAHC